MKIKTLILLLLIASSWTRADNKGLLTTLREDYYREMSQREQVDPEVRIIWLDSLLNISQTGHDQIRLQKVKCLRDAGYPDKALSLADAMLDSSHSRRRSKNTLVVSASRGLKRQWTASASYGGIFKTLCT